MNATNMSKIKYLINAVSRYELELCIEQALAANSGTEIRTIFTNYMNKKELGGFIRAGK
jgi:phosphotransferase system enzyme I (PtsP)